MGLTADTVIVPIDFSDASPRAAAAAKKLTGGPQNLTFVYVLQPLEAISPGAVWGTVDDSNREKAVREHGATFLKENGLEGAAFEVVMGQPANEVCEYARRRDADLIVISTHGYHGMKRMLLGSTAESIIRHAHCDVLVLRRPDAE